MSALTLPSSASCLRHINHLLSKFPVYGGLMHPLILLTSSTTGSQWHIMVGHAGQFQDFVIHTAGAGGGLANHP